MAIIPGFPGVEVTILINGKAAVEYDDHNTREKQHQHQHQHQNQNVIFSSKFIECEDNAPFKIHLKVTDKYDWGYTDHIVKMGVFIDGECVAARSCKKTMLGPEGWEVTLENCIYLNDGKITKQGFKFVRITKDNHPHNGLRAARMGNIEVRIFRAIQIEPGSPSYGAPPPSKDFTVTKKALKGRAVSHAAGFFRSKKFPGDNGPIATFRFLYCSKEALILEGVITLPQAYPGQQHLPERITKESTKGAAYGLLAGLTQEQIEALAVERLQQDPNAAAFLRKRKHEEEEGNMQERKLVKREDAQWGYWSGWRC